MDGNGNGLSVSWSTTLVQTGISQHLLDGLLWNIHGSQGMNPTDFGNPLTFPLVPTVGQSSLIK